MKKLLSVLFLILAGCGTTNDPIEWPTVEADCNYYTVEPVGNCAKIIELCTFGGEHCMTNYVCGQAHPMGCIKP